MLSEFGGYLTEHETSSELPSVKSEPRSWKPVFCDFGSARVEPVPFPVDYANTHTKQSEKLQEKGQNAGKSLPADLRITGAGALISFRPFTRL